MKRNPPSGKVLISVFTLLSAAALILYFAFPVDARVGRLPAINEWLRRIFSGEFPYGGPTNPSGLPFLFVLASPFYLINNAGLLSLLGILLIFVIIYVTSATKKEIIFKSAVLLLLPTTYYEFIVRSELAFNSVIYIFLLIFLTKKTNPGKVDFAFIAGAVAAGCIFATRLLIPVIFIIWLLYFFRFYTAKGFVYLLISAAVLILWILPFYFWNTEIFITRGPFAIQSVYLPYWSLAIVLLMIVVAGWSISDFREVLFSTGLILFITTTLSFVFTIYREGFDVSFHGSRSDLSYYVLCVPFLISVLKERTEARNN